MPNANSGKPSLDNARARIIRAGEHIARLKDERRAVFEHHTQMSLSFVGNAVAVTNVTHSRSIVADETFVVPPIVSILVGEAIYNLRAALDYLIYELSILDDPTKVTDRMQFPIESWEKNWPQRKGDWLRALSAWHKAAIKEYQPFVGVRWTACLRDISNPDKHRHLIFAVARSNVIGTVSMLTRYGKTGRQTVMLDAAPHGANGPVEVDADSIFNLLFEDGTPVVETLQSLQREVSNVIVRFDPDFK